MSSELEFLSRYVARGKLSRRDFLGRAAALGVSATFANGLLSSAARAEGPVKGGTLKAGLVGGESTNVLDPALAMTQVPFAFGKMWGELIVELSPEGGLEYRIAEEIGSSDDAKTWTLKIRDGIEFHNGKTVTAEDVAATLERHSDEKSKSGALGYMKGIETIKVDGKNVVLTLKEANADLPYLLSDYHIIVHPNGGKYKPGAASGPCP
jgi:peptide/nickel transport system substrate-binding protein